MSSKRFKKLNEDKNTKGDIFSKLISEIKKNCTVKFEESIDKRIPGEIIMINKKTGIKVMSKDYPIQIICAQLEGKKATDSYTLSVQSNMLVSNIFGS